MPTVYHFVQLPLFILSKPCSKCRIEKSLDDFHRDNGFKDGHRSICKSCIYIYAKSCRERTNERRRNHIRIPDASVEVKTCNDCHKEKAVSDFHKSKREKDGYKPDCKTCRSRKALEYSQRNREHIRAQKIRSAREHPHGRKQYHHDHYLANQERISKRNRAYHVTHLDEARVRSRNYRLANPIRNREYRMRREARRKNASLGKVDYHCILERDGRWCYICEKDILSHHKLHFDHVIPLLRHGTHAEDNIRPTHQVCNQRKQAKLLEEMTAFQRRGPDK